MRNQAQVTADRLASARQWARQAVAGGTYKITGVTPGPECEAINEELAGRGLYLAGTTYGKWLLVDSTVVVLSGMGTSEHTCPGCGLVLPEQGLCQTCRDSIGGVSGHRCTVCGEKLRGDVGDGLLRDLRGNFRERVKERP